VGLIGRTPLALLRAGGRLSRAFRTVSKPGGGRCLILMYHDIGIGIATELFNKEMEYLRARARVVSLEELLERSRSDGVQGVWCAITFDDGYEGVYRHAFPSLMDFGFPAIVYLSTAFIRDSGWVADTGRRGLIEGQPMLSWRQVREMDQRGVRFGSHLCEHGDLSVLGRGEAMAQLCRSRQEISTRLGKPCEHFAYPFGSLTPHSARWVREAGYRTAVTTVHRPLTAGDDPYRLPRVGIEDRYSLRDFASAVRGDWDFIGLLQTLRRPTLRMR
jgi:peptidoglycan/xylan/chitin deacetylase (PgdA/CDA1 family)